MHISMNLSKFDVKKNEITPQNSTFQSKYLLILHKIRNFAHDFNGKDKKLAVIINKSI